MFKIKEMTNTHDCIDKHVITVLYYCLTTAECTECPAGTSCPDLAMNTTLPCPAGYYCLNGTTDDGEPCPIGQ